MTSIADPRNTHLRVYLLCAMGMTKADAKTFLARAHHAERETIEIAGSVDMVEDAKTLHDAIVAIDEALAFPSDENFIRASIACGVRKSPAELKAIRECFLGRL